MIEEGVDRMKTEAGDAPLIAVGGGSFLVPPRLAGVSEVLNVPHQAVANAVGAAIAQVSGEVDQIFQDLPRDEAIARARRLAEDKAVVAGKTCRRPGSAGIRCAPGCASSERSPAGRSVRTAT
jgi:hypothetical protein